MNIRIVLLSLLAAIIPAVQADVIKCKSQQVLCVGGDAPAVPPEQSFWTSKEELKKLNNLVEIGAHREGLSCKMVDNPHVTCSKKWSGSFAMHAGESSGFFNQIYVKMPHEDFYRIEIEPIAPDAYAALKKAYVDTISAKFRRAIPGALTKGISWFMGKQYNKPDVAHTTKHINELLEPFGFSWNGTSGQVVDAKKAEFARALGVDPSEWVVPVGGYQTYNDFFAHSLIKEARPITGTNSADIVSPADSKLTIVENVKNQITLFKVKQDDFTLEKFLGDESLARQFDGGTIMIFRLSPYNYHRFHIAVDGIPAKSVMIKEKGLESVDPIAYKTGIDALIINKRERVVIDTPYGKMVTVIVGAFGVGTIVNTYKPCEFTTKGAELGYFAFGGSTLVLVFEKGAITFADQEVLEHSRKGYETAIKMGEKVASFVPTLFNSSWNPNELEKSCALIGPHKKK